MRILFSLTDTIDYAHDGLGFPTWHRLFQLWLEREIQIHINDHTFRLPYWEWTDPSQRVTPFQTDRLGANVRRDVNGTQVTVVEGDLFDNNWETYCWEDMSKYKSHTTIPICDPTTPSGEILRRCPRETFCDMNNRNWPSVDDVKHALSIDTYDASPYNRTVKGTNTSFRNYMEGFIVDPDNCGTDDMCSKGKDDNYYTRKLHNTVS